MISEAKRGIIRERAYYLVFLREQNNLEARPLSYSAFLLLIIEPSLLDYVFPEFRGFPAYQFQE